VDVDMQNNSLADSAWLQRINRDVKSRLYGRKLYATEFTVPVWTVT